MKTAEAIDQEISGVKKAIVSLKQNEQKPGDFKDLINANIRHLRSLETLRDELRKNHENQIQTQSLN